jgi:hypothetical protein
MFSSLKKLRFSSSTFYESPNRNPYAPAPAQAPAPPMSAMRKPISLRAPMIDRVHKTRPGCSACGKRVV